MLSDAPGLGDRQDIAVEVRTEVGPVFQIALMFEANRLKNRQWEPASPLRHFIRQLVRHCSTSVTAFADRRCQAIRGQRRAPACQPISLRIPNWTRTAQRPIQIIPD
ncbi:hypothetical protein [Bradyrhizobium sp. CCGUVB23]|uniref:hypothetical protein n=1 Tax=Bradyrhizobium sp. CCGUVB23 TaxID=2949630 RepID=UPI003531BE85